MSVQPVVAVRQISDGRVVVINLSTLDWIKHCPLVPDVRASVPVHADPVREIERALYGQHR
jgi:hypothetical protein